MKSVEHMVAISRAKLQHGAFQFPLSGTWAIGVLLGIKLFFVGIMMVTGGSAIRSIAKEA